MGRPKFMIAASAALLNAVTVGICATYSSTATESMRDSSLHPTDTEVSWIGSTLPLGAVFGGIVAGKSFIFIMKVYLLNELCHFIY